MSKSPLAVSGRPDGPPKGQWLMRQVWHDLLFAHWSFEPDVLRPLIPAGLDLDLLDGRGWVGVIPFRVSGSRAHWLPPGPARAFAEVNVRTYVTWRGRPGVLFLSLDCSSRFAVEGARFLFHVPYFWAHASLTRDGSSVVFASRRRDGRGSSGAIEATYEPGPEVSSGDPERRARWLVERYRLFTAAAPGVLMTAEIDHPPWNLREARAEIRQTLLTAAGLPSPEGPPLLHYADRQDAVIWPPRRLPR